MRSRLCWPFFYCVLFYQTHNNKFNVQLFYLYIFIHNLTPMDSKPKNQQRFYLTSTNQITRHQLFRKSIGSLPLSKIDNASKTTDVNLVTRRASFGKTQKRITIKPNKFTIMDNPIPVNKFKEAADRLSFFQQYLSQNHYLKEYKMMSHIGKGCFSTVSLAIHKESNINYAIKTYDKIDNLEQYRLDSIKRQIKHLKNLDHKNVISLIHVFKDKNKMLLLMDNGGKQSLSGLLRKNKNFDESTAKLYFKQIVEGISYCHQRGVCHRDIKPQNILVDDDGHVKVIDFGFSANTKNKLKTYCGTPPFMCPEITKKMPYSGAAADVWALGIMLYQLVIGHLPFRATNQAELSRLIQQGKYPKRQQISKSLKGILDRMLQCNPEKRVSARDLLNDPWMR